MTNNFEGARKENLIAGMLRNFSDEFVRKFELKYDAIAS